jgi:CubicO group peptidase (beta-lactamase class C family)
MTKPVIGASILMLIEDGAIKLDDRVAKYLPSFDVEGLRDITIEHLLTHTSGLPLSLLPGKDLKTLGGIRAVAKLGAGHKLPFRSGKSFIYSDQGTDTLTALIEVASGMTANEFVTQRVLLPLGMRDSTCVMAQEHPLRSRVASKYIGSRGQWTEFWAPDKPPLFPFFLGSQGLYSTAEDYARFMDLWLNVGRVDDKQLLDLQLVKKALTPSPQPFPGSSGLAGLRPDYGYMMQLWKPMEKNAKNNGIVAFGHSGSDGTYSWVFPKQNAMVMYFTQSRGTTTGLRVEAAVNELFLDVPVEEMHDSAPPLEQYLGYYAENERSRYQAIIRDGEDLALETPGKRIRKLVYAGEDRWTFRSKPSVVLVFERTEAGQVMGFQIGKQQKELRFQPAADLPRTQELAARVAKTHRLDLLESVGPVRMTSKLTMDKFMIKGDSSLLFGWPNYFREESKVLGQVERLAFNGQKATYSMKKKPAVVLKDARANEQRTASPAVRFGDWRQWYPHLRVIQLIKNGEREVFVVRAGDTSGTASTYYVDSKTNRVIREERIVHTEMQGRIGQRLTFSDFRDVSGMLLPFETMIELANPILGPIVTKVTDVKVGENLPQGVFQITD